MYHPETENFIQDASARSFRRALNIFFLLLGGALLGAGLGWQAWPPLLSFPGYLCEVPFQNLALRYPLFL